MSRPASPCFQGRIIAAGALASMWTLFFAGQILSAADVPYYRDNLLTYVPLRHYIHSRLRSGSLPQWFPFESLGVPFIGQIATGLFHPATWVLLPLSDLSALKWNLLLAYLMGAFGAYRFARYLSVTRVAALTGAVAFAFGGYILGVSSVLFYLMGMATLPWLAWAIHRVAREARPKDAALLALVGALLFYAADVQSLLMSLLLVALALAIEGVRKRALLMFSAAAIATVLLCGLELVPALRVAADAIRVQGVRSSTLGTTWSLHAWRLPEFLIPGYIPDAVRSRVTGELFRDGTSVFATTVFAGGSVLVLAALGLCLRTRMALAYGVLAAVGIWLALGDQGRLLPLAQRWLPALAWFRYPIKYVSLFWLALVPLVALGVDSVRRHPLRALAGFSGTWAVTGLASSVVAARGAAWEVWRSADNVMAVDDPARVILDDAWSSGLLWTSAFTGAAALILFLARRRPGALMTLPLLVFLELWHGNSRHLPMVPAAVLRAPNAFATAVLGSGHSAEPTSRVAHEVDVSASLTVTGESNAAWVEANQLLLKPDLSAFYGLESFGENLGGTSIRQGLLLGPKAKWAPRYAPILNGCFVVTSDRASLKPDQVPLVVAPSTQWQLIRQKCWARAFLAGTTSEPNIESALRRMQSTEISQIAVPWEGGPQFGMPQGTVHWTRHDPELLELEVEAGQAGALVISDAYAPGWSATVDGQVTRIYPTLVMARGIAISAGRHHVKMTYRTPGLRLGIVMTAAGAFLCTALLLYGARRRSLPLTP